MDLGFSYKEKTQLRKTLQGLKTQTFNTKQIHQEPKFIQLKSVPILKLLPPIVLIYVIPNNINTQLNFIDAHFFTKSWQIGKPMSK